MSPQVKGNPLAALGCQIWDDGLWVHRIPVHVAEGECQVAVGAPTLKVGYFTSSF